MGGIRRAEGRWNWWGEAEGGAIHWQTALGRGMEPRKAPWPGQPQSGPYEFVLAISLAQTPRIGVAGAYPGEGKISPYPEVMSSCLLTCVGYSAGQLACLFLGADRIVPLVFYLQTSIQRLVYTFLVTVVIMVPHGKLEACQLVVFIQSVLCFLKNNNLDQVILTGTTVHGKREGSPLLSHFFSTKNLP